MRAYRYDDFQSLDSLRIHEEPMPEPQRGELLLKVHSVSLNYRDLAMILGRYVNPTTPGLVPASDAAAEVVAVGEGVKDFKSGDRVVSIFHPRWFGGRSPQSTSVNTYGSSRDGWLTEYKVVSQEAVVPFPDSMSYDEGATLPCAAVTAWTALTGPSPVRLGKTVLTLGTGGVSIFAVQLAKAMGARVISTTSSAHKMDVLRSLGADEVINYVECPQWEDEVRKLTGGEGVDCVVEVGGPGTISQSLRSVARGGEVVLVGFLSEENPGVDYYLLKKSRASVRSIGVGDRAAAEELIAAATMMNLKPVIDQVFPFEDARGAFERLHSGKHIGKIVIKIGS